MIKTYRLVVAGTVTFDEKDQHILELLRGPTSPTQIEKALQELKEEAKNVGVVMEFIKEEPNEVLPKMP